MSSAWSTAFSAIRVMSASSNVVAAVRPLELDAGSATAAARSLQSGGSGPPENRPSTGPGRSSSRATWWRSARARRPAPGARPRRSARSCRPARRRRASPAGSSSASRQATTSAARSCSEYGARRVGASAIAGVARVQADHVAALGGEPLAQLGVPGRHRVARAVQQQQGGIAGRAERLGVQLPRPVPEAHAPGG